MSAIGFHGINTDINVSCKGGTLYWPSRTTIDVAGGSAISHAPLDRFRPSDRTWLPSSELTGLAGKNRELFYATGGGICYAGTFQASRNIIEYTTGEYRSLCKEVSNFIAQLPGADDITHYRSFS